MNIIAIVGHDVYMFYCCLSLNYHVVIFADFI